MDDSGHELKAPVSQDLYAHDLPHIKPTGDEERESRNVPLRPPPDPLQGSDEDEEIARQLPLSSENQPEEFLVTQAEQGNNEAFGILSEHYTKPIHRYIRRLIGDSEIALDLTQETILKAWQSLPMRDQKRTLNFHPWIYRIAYTTTMDYLRKNPLDNLTVPIEDKNERAPKHSSWAERVESDLCKYESIKAALKQVYPQYRQCMIMRYMGDYSFQEIAQELSISEVTVRVNISRGRKQFIRAYLREMSNDTGRNGYG